MQRRLFLSSLGAAATAAAAGAHAGLRVAPPPTPRAKLLPNVVLRTQHNREVRLYEDLLKDKIFLINMFFVACTDGACPVVSANLAKVQPLLGPRLGQDIFMYSFSLDPERDTPESLRAYAEFFKPHPGWLFLTGQPADIERLRRALGYWDPDPVRDARKTTHSGMALIGNEALDRWTGCPTRAVPREIARVMSYVDWPKGWDRNPAARRQT